MARIIEPTSKPDCHTRTRQSSRCRRMRRSSAAYPRMRRRRGGSSWQPRAQDMKGWLGPASPGYEVDVTAAHSRGGCPCPGLMPAGGVVFFDPCGDPVNGGPMWTRLRRLKMDPPLCVGVF